MLIRLRKGDGMSYLPEFAYVLWTTDNGAHCWVRIKKTKEEIEVSREVFRELRKEEDKLKQLKEEPDPAGGADAKRFYEINHPLSLEYFEAEEDVELSPAWLISHKTPESETVLTELEKQLMEALTERQRDCYYNCVVLGESKYNYAKRTGISASRVNELFVQIARKLKKLL